MHTVVRNLSTSQWGIAIFGGLAENRRPEIEGPKTTKDVSAGSENAETNY